MKHVLFTCCLALQILTAQNNVEAKLIKSYDVNDETIISFDNFGRAYFIKDNVFYIKTSPVNLSYNNFQLGNLTSINTFNPLKINLFYKDFNTVIILDNRLAEIYKIDFNRMSPYINVSHVSTGNDNTLWVFNQDLQRLELFDYKSQTTRAQIVPVQSYPLDLVSNFNYCWLLTEKYLFMYNYFGRLVKKIENNGYTEISQYNENVILKKNDKLYYLGKNEDIIRQIQTPNLSINAFFVTNETLYIYNDETLQQYQLKTN
ncbi:hypothetical protein [Cognatitamlana onchidii]|uniref:hypothetical protein n=1 Tax=Cognatitamlana onchidii TaxID=2562860 RepID=UPI0010A5D5D8|nr:hypothetical protein [Algibacter onchidii]